MSRTATRRDLLSIGTSAAAYAAGAAIVTGGVVLADEAQSAPMNVTLDRSAWDTASTVLRREQERDALIDARHSETEANGTLTSQLEQEWSDSIDPLSDAEWALFDAPAPDHAALEWKLAFLRDRDIGLQQNVSDQLIADVRRLAKTEG